MTERLHFHFSLSCIGEGNGNPLQRSCLENPRDGRAWWAAVYGVAQSRTRLKRLSSSSSSDCFLPWNPHFMNIYCAYDDLLRRNRNMLMNVIYKIQMYSLMCMCVCCCCCCCVASVVSDSVRLHRRQPTRLPRPRDSPGKNTGVVAISFSNA